MQTFCFNRRFALVQIAFLLTATHHNPWNVDTPLFQKAYRLFGSFSTWTVQNSLDNVVACLPLTQGCPPLLINSTTGQCNSTGTCMHSISLWSVFLASTQQGRALECAFVALNSTGTHCHAYQKYTGSLRNTDASTIRTRNGSPMMSAIEGFHCSAHLAVSNYVPNKRKLSV